MGGLVHPRILEHDAAAAKIYAERRRGRRANSLESDEASQIPERTWRRQEPGAAGGDAAEDPTHGAQRRSRGRHAESLTESLWPTPPGFRRGVLDPGLAHRIGRRPWSWPAAQWGVALATAATVFLAAGAGVRVGVLRLRQRPPAGRGAGPRSPCGDRLLCCRSRRRAASNMADDGRATSFVTVYCLVESRRSSTSSTPWGCRRAEPPVPDANRFARDERRGGAVTRQRLRGHCTPGTRFPRGAARDDADRCRSKRLRVADHRVLRGRRDGSGSRCCWSSRARRSSSFLNFSKAALTSGVQAAFVVGCVASALLRLADRLDPRAIFGGLRGNRRCGQRAAVCRRSVGRGGAGAA